MVEHEGTGAPVPLPGQKMRRCKDAKEKWAAMATGRVKTTGAPPQVL